MKLKTISGDYLAFAVLPRLAELDAEAGRGIRHPSLYILLKLQRQQQHERRHVILHRRAVKVVLITKGSAKCISGPVVLVLF
jgi:hypothetical protein